MPLSRLGIAEIAEATAAPAVSLFVASAEQVREALGEPADAGDVGWDRPDGRLARDLVAAGVTTHYPAVLMYSGGRRMGNAILGFKTAAAWETLIRGGITTRRSASWAMKDGSGYIAYSPVRRTVSASGTEP